MTDQLTGYIPTLSDAHKKTPIGPRLETLTLLKNIQNFTLVEPFLVEKILPIVLNRLDDKPQVVESALEVGLNFVSRFSIQAFPRVIEILFREMTTESKWKAKLGSLKLLGSYVDRVENMDRDLLSACLPELVSNVSGIVYDTKPEVAELAEEVLRKVMKGITNRDLEPFVEDLIKAMKDRDETEETIQKLGGIVFVQTVEGSALSVVIPLMIAGFRESKSQVKRMCSRIVSNMSKLVEDPLEAKPFLSD